MRAPKPHALGAGVVIECIFLSAETRRPLDHSVHCRPTRSLDERPRSGRSCLPAVTTHTLVVGSRSGRSPLVGSRSLGSSPTTFRFFNFRVRWPRNSIRGQTIMAKQTAPREAAVSPSSGRFQVVCGGDRTPWCGVRPSVHWQMRGRPSQHRAGLPPGAAHRGEATVVFACSPPPGSQQPLGTPNLDPPPFDTGRPLSSNRLCPLSSMHRLQKARHNRSGSPRSGCIRALVGRR